MSHLFHTHSTAFKDALKYGFYELQNIRDWYREVTSDVGMHADLVKYWIRVSTLLVTPVAPHFAEHIWTEFLKEPKSVQLARWPEPGRAADRTVIEAGAYMRTTLKMIRDAETTLLKKLQKGRKGKVDGPSFDPKLPKSVRIYVASRFPEWQDVCVQAIKDSYSVETYKVDDVRVRAVLTENGILKDKRAMPFIQAFKVCFLIVRVVEPWIDLVLSCVETHVGNWCYQCVPSNVAVLRVRDLGRVSALPEEISEFG